MVGEWERKENEEEKWEIKVGAFEMRVEEESDMVEGRWRVKEST